MPNEPICVRRTTTVEAADIIVAWLAEHDIAATIPDRDSFGTFAFGVTDTEGVQVCVADEATAVRARVLLDEHERELKAEAAKLDEERLVEVTCEECGFRCTFAAELRGSVQECPECGAFVDVPRCVG
ncbi:MAG TPA: hypothetical protein PKK06_13500 [Phycisphaerae bacterium]|nr:hypothetical protein [Phycisphaerae bacterium]HNU46101.1 hypothetical protein [Phycisphaerae bacterium]